MKKVSNNSNSFEIMYFVMLTFCVEMMTCVSPYGYLVISVIITIKYSKNDIYLINEFWNISKHLSGEQDIYEI